jgi:hypothetical protein
MAFWRVSFRTNYRRPRMSDILFGGELSGTPIETRGGTEKLATDIVSPGGGRIQRGATTGALGFDPSMTGVESAARRILADPTDRLRGLFAALEPFEERQTEEAVAGVRGGFGRLGGRFSENLVDAEARTRGELAGQFARTREESILEAGGQQTQLIGLLLNALLAGRGQTLDFFAPGGPNFREGILADLIGAGGAAAAASIGAPAAVGAAL